MEMYLYEKWIFTFWQMFVALFHTGIKINTKISIYEEIDWRIFENKHLTK